MTDYDWANPHAAEGAPHNCRFYAETYDCRDQTAFVALHWLSAAVSLVSVLFMSGCLLYNRRISHGRLMVMEKVLICWTVFLALRFVFSVVMLSRLLDHYIIAKMLLQNIAWPIHYIASYIYMDSVLATLPSKDGSMYHERYRYTVRTVFMVTAALAVISTNTFTVLAGWARSRDDFWGELTYYRTVKWLYTFFCFIFTVGIWYYSRRLLQVTRQRTLIMDQFPQQVPPTLPPADGQASVLFPESGAPTGAHAAYLSRLARFREGHRRVAMLNLVTAGSFGFFVIILVPYAALLQVIVPTPWANMLFHLLINVIGSFTFVVAGAVFSVMAVRHHRTERTRHQQEHHSGTGGGSYNSRNDPSNSQRRSNGNGPSIDAYHGSYQPVTMTALYADLAQLETTYDPSAEPSTSTCQLYSLSQQHLVDTKDPHHH